MDAALRQQLERVRVKLLLAYRQLRDEGAVTEERYAEAAEVIGQIERLSIDEVRSRLGSLVPEDREEAA